MHTDLTAKNFSKAIGNATLAVVIDVRTPMEFSRGRIANTINIPVDKIEEKMQMLFPNKFLEIFVYCLSGSRSAVAAEVLASLGYEKIFNLENGLLAWRNEQLPVQV